MNFFLLLLPAESLLLMIFIHIIYVRLQKAPIAPSGIFVGFTAGIISMILGIFFFISKNLFLLSFLNGAAALFFYFILAYCYYHVVNISEASVRLRIFSELKEKKCILLSTLASYQQNEVSLRRIERLLVSKDIILKNDKYFLGQKRYLIAAKILQSAKLLLGVKINF